MNLADLQHAASWMYRWNSPGEYLCGAMVQEVFVDVQEIFERKKRCEIFYFCFDGGERISLFGIQVSTYRR